MSTVVKGVIRLMLTITVLSHWVLLLLWTAGADEEYADKHEHCEYWASTNECDNYPVFMLSNCAKSCKKIKTKNEKIKIRNCVNSHDHNDCEKWAAEGECDINPSFMKPRCAYSCDTCDWEARCEPHKYRQPALNLSNLARPQLFDKVFKRILSSKHLCQKYDISMLSFDPPIIQFDNFVPDEMVSEIMSFEFKYERSVEVGELDENNAHREIISNSRTSTQDWCDGECEKIESIQYLLSFMEEATGIDQIHYEHFQLLKYEVGEHYKEHHDLIDNAIYFPSGPRILTFFVYLNDVEEGGETEFPQLGIKVKPKKGRAVLWPSVESNDPFKKLESTHHAALDVIKGTKYAINAWIHLFDFKTPNTLGCTG